MPRASASGPAHTALHWLSVGGSLEALKSGCATFGIDSASLTGGRFQAQLMAHFGERLVPYFRAGVGVFFGSQTQVGRDAEFLSGGVWELGLGADVWLTDDLVGGVSLAYFDGAIASAEFGLHPRVRLGAVDPLSECT